MCSGTSSVGSATSPSGNRGKSRISSTRNESTSAPPLARTSGVPTTALVWFRRDLRVHDHPALTAAHRECDRVVPVFVLDPRLLQGRFPSRNRAWFLHGCLTELRAALRERGADLVVREGRPEEELPALAAEVGASAYFASDVSPFAMARDRRVEEALGRAGVEVRRQPGLFVADVGQVRTKDGRPHSVFTPFHRAWEQAPRRELHGAPRRLAFPPASRPALPGPAEATGRRARRAGRERAAWLRGLERYHERHDLLAGGTSELSPYLHFGCVSPRELEQRARERGGRGAFVRQLAWRDFYAHVLLNHPGNARHAHRREFDSLEWDDDEALLDAWREGRTGYPVVDAAMRQLLARGWMHNRGRLIVGSFLTKTCTSTGGTARPTSCATCCAATRPPTTATGSGSPRSASTPRPTSGACTTRSSSSAATTRTASTCAAGCRSCARCPPRSSPSRGR